MSVSPLAAPRWADFPNDEYRQRLDKAQRLMRAAGLDLMILTEKENVEYFSGFRSVHWGSKTFPPGIVVVHATKDPVLLIPDFFAGTAAGTSWFDRVELSAEPHAQPRAFAQRLVEVVIDLGGRTGAIGLESGTHLIPRWNQVDYEAVRSSLGSADFRSAEEVIWGCRTIKSPREIDMMRRITDMTDGSIMAMQERLRQGMTERDIGRIVGVEMLERGADNVHFLNIRAGLDRYPMADSAPYERTIGADEMVLVDVGTSFAGYVTDVAYCGFTGTPDPLRLQMYETCLRGQAAAIDALRPGARAADVYRASMRAMEDRPRGKVLDLVGHGIGMDMHEPPMLSPYDERTIEAGMVFAVEPWVYDTTDLGFFLVEEMVLVTEDGPEILSKVPRDELWVID